MYIKKILRKFMHFLFADDIIMSQVILNSVEIWMKKRIFDSLTRREKIKDTRYHLRKDVMHVLFFEFRLHNSAIKPLKSCKAHQDGQSPLQISFVTMTRMAFY